MSSGNLRENRRDRKPKGSYRKGNLSRDRRSLSGEPKGEHDGEGEEEKKSNSEGYKGRHFKRTEEEKKRKIEDPAEKEKRTEKEMYRRNRTENRHW